MNGTNPFYDLDAYLVSGGIIADIKYPNRRPISQEESESYFMYLNEIIYEEILDEVEGEVTDIKSELRGIREIINKFSKNNPTIISNRTYYGHRFNDLTSLENPIRPRAAPRKPTVLAAEAPPTVRGSLNGLTGNPEGNMNYNSKPPKYDRYEKTYAGKKKDFKKQYLSKKRQKGGGGINKGRKPRRLPVNLRKLMKLSYYNNIQ